MNKTITSTKGIVIAFLGALLLTPDTLFMRLSEMNIWTMLFWRGFQMGIVLIIFTLIIKKYRDNFSLIFSKPGILISVTQSLGSIFFTIGIYESSVALILFCIATSPLFASLFSFMILKEIIKKSTIMASFFCILGILIVVLDADNVSNSPNNNVILGSICGLFTAASLGLNFVLLRLKPDIPPFGVTGFGGFLIGILSLFLVDFNEIFEGDIISISISGLIILPFSFAALTYATRYTIAANISLLMLLETIFGPIWVWLFLNETIGVQMIFGGLIVISSLVIYFSKFQSTTVKPSNSG